MDADFKKIHQSAEKLRVSADRLQKFHAEKKKLTRAGQLSKRDSTRLERLEAQFVAANVAVQEVLPATPAAEVLAEEDPVPFEFGEFFKKVADGFVRAQQDLDAASAQYLAAVSKQPHALPSVFRIPRVAADVKFALENKKEKGINLLFFKNEDSETTRNEQSIQFEMVSAPPPAGLVVGPVSAFPVLAKSRRAELFTVIQEFKLPNSTVAQTNQALDRPKLVADPDSVIIISVDGDSRFLLTVASSAAAGNVGFWYLEIISPTEVSLAVIRKFGAATDPNIGKVGEFIFKIGTLQKEFLGKLP